MPPPGPTRSLARPSAPQPALRADEAPQHGVGGHRRGHGREPVLRTEDAVLDPGGEGHEGDQHDVKYCRYRPVNGNEHGMFPFSFGRSCRVPGASLPGRISWNSTNDSDCYLSFIEGVQGTD